MNLERFDPAAWMSDVLVVITTETRSAARRPTRGQDRSGAWQVTVGAIAIGVASAGSLGVFSPERGPWGAAVPPVSSVPHQVHEKRSTGDEMTPLDWARVDNFLHALPKFEEQDDDAEPYI